MGEIMSGFDDWDTVQAKRRKRQFKNYFTQRNLMLLTLRLKGTTYANLGELVGLTGSRVRQIAVILKYHFDRALKDKTPEAEFIKRWIDENDLQEHFPNVD
jgi:hypothetical protein